MARSVLSISSPSAATLCPSAVRKTCPSSGALAGTVDRHAVGEKLAVRPTSHVMPAFVVRVLKVTESENDVAGQTGATLRESHAGSVRCLGVSKSQAICHAVDVLRRSAVVAAIAAILATLALSGHGAARPLSVCLVLVCPTMRPNRRQKSAVGTRRRPLGQSNCPMALKQTVTAWSLVAFATTVEG